MNPSKLPSILASVAQRMRADFDAASAFRHDGVRGDERERIVCDFLAKYLPGHVRAAHSGEIVSASGEVSGACDILIFDRSTPPLMDTGDHRIVPAECVYGVVEVKSVLNKPKLLEACEQVRLAKIIPKTAFYRGVGGPSDRHWKRHGRTYDYMPTVGMIFAFDGPSLESTASNLREWTAGKPPEEWPDSIWVLGKGAVTWFNPETGRVDLSPSLQSAVGWYPADTKQDTLLLLAVMLNAHFVQASMPPLRLLDYAEGHLGGPRHVWIDEDDQPRAS